MIKFTNAKILSLDKKDIDGNFVVENDLSVIVKDDKIFFVGDNEKLKNFEKSNKIEKYDKVIDVKNNLLMPSFKNAHTHSAMTILRSYADDLPLQRWLNEKIFPAESKLEREDIYYFSIIAILEYLTSGITYNFDMYKYYDEIANASINCHFRTKIIESLTKFDNYIENIPSFYEKYNKLTNDVDHLISYDFGVHAEYTNDEHTLEMISQLTHKYRTQFYSHSSETKKEVAECLKRYNKTPTELFDSFGLYDFGGGLFHGVYLTDDDLEIINKHKLAIVINSSSNLKLASGIANTKKYLEKKINLCLGTDGPASNNSLDMFREMYLTSVLSKYVNNNPNSISPTKILEMATINPMKAINRNDLLYLKEGQKADIIMIDLHMPNMFTQNNIVSDIVYSASKINVKMTMINGIILYEDNNFNKCLDVEYVYKKSRERIKKLGVANDKF